METLEHYKSLIDEQYLEVLEMIHKGKDIDSAINQAYAHVVAGERDLTGSEFKRLVNTWLINQKETIKRKVWKL